MSKNNHTNLCLGHLNAYHIKNKIPDISVLLQKQSSHILGLSETRLHKNCKPKILDVTLEPANYKIIRRDIEHQLHMGLAVLVHTSIFPFTKRRKDLESDIVECIWIEIKLHSRKPILIGNFYRNGAYGNDWIESFIDMMYKVYANYNDIILLGDFNIKLNMPQLSWHTTLRMLNLTQLVNLPTRVAKDCSSLLDHIYTNNTALINDVKVIDSSISDHKSIFCYLPCLPKCSHIQKGCHTTIEYRNFKEFNSLKFSHDLSNAPFDSVYSLDNGENAITLLTDILLSVINRHAPLRSKRVKHTTIPPWLSKDIINAMAIRDSLKKANKIIEFREQRQKVKKLVKEAKATYFRKLVDENKSIKTVWSAINEITNKARHKSTNPASHILPDKFNDFFLSISERILPNKSSESNNLDISNLKAFCKSKLPSYIGFSIPLLTVFDVGKFIESLTNKKSMGPDKIPPYLLKLALPYIIEPLTFAYNLCIKQNIFPSSLKTARVIPLPKGNHSKEPEDFRPISILPILAKPLEKHVQKHLLQFMEKNNLFYKFQSGFRENHSCYTAINALTNTWLESIETQKLTGAVFLDFKKAFDLVNHDILLKKTKFIFTK